jgi:hypothetical protein
MVKKFTLGANYSADAITGERFRPGEDVIDTGIPNKESLFMRRSKTRLIKEATIVWLAEGAGFTVTKRNGGDSGNAEVVDREDAGLGGGAPEAGKVKAGGGKPSGKRPSGDDAS